MKGISTRTQSVLSILIAVAALLVGFRLCDTSAGGASTVVIALGVGAVSGLATLLVGLWAQTPHQD
jgi:hypothetical protein